MGTKLLDEIPLRTAAIGSLGSTSSEESRHFHASGTSKLSLLAWAHNLLSATCRLAQRTWTSYASHSSCKLACSVSRRNKQCEQAAPISPQRSSHYCPSSLQIFQFLLLMMRSRNGLIFTQTYFCSASWV